MSTLGDNIRKARTALGLSQEQAARKLGVSLMTWNRWEVEGKWQVNPPVPQLQRIAAVLQTTVSKLTEGM